MSRELERDTLFQINAIVWATMPLAADPNGTYKAALYDAGCRLESVEMPLRATLGDLSRMHNSGLRITETPVADIVLRVEGSPARFVLIEAKASSFGPAGDGRAVRQARGLIFAAGNAASRVGAIGSPKGFAYHLVPAEQLEPMAQSDEQIVTQLRDASLVPVGDVGVLGLNVRADGVWITCQVVKDPSGGQEAPLFDGELLILTSETDPRPLYIVPWHPDCDDPISERIFAQKAKTRFIGWLQDAPLGGAFADYQQLLSNMSAGVYDAWRDHDTLQSKLVPALRTVLINLCEGLPVVSLQSAGVMVDLHDEGARDELIRQIAAVRVGASDAEGFQPPLETASD